MLETEWKNGTMVKTTAQLTIKGQIYYVVPALLNVKQRSNQKGLKG